MHRIIAIERLVSECDRYLRCSSSDRLGPAGASTDTDARNLAYPKDIGRIQAEAADRFLPMIGETVSEVDGSARFYGLSNPNIGSISGEEEKRRSRCSSSPVKPPDGPICNQPSACIGLQPENQRSAGLPNGSHPMTPRQ